MRFFKTIGLLSLICFTFFYTEKVIDISIEQDSIMNKINESMNELNQEPKNAIIDKDTIIPGNIGKKINKEASYKEMKKIGYYEKTLLKYDNIYPEISIYNNYNKYIINGNILNNKIALVYTINNNKNLNNLLNNISKNIKLNLFISSNYLNNNISILNKLKDYNINIYNYGNNGIYTKENLIITNNIINNKSNNQSIYCLFLEKNTNSLNNCTNSKMLSIYINNKSNYKEELKNGYILYIDNSKDINYINDYITSKGYNISYLNEIIKE